MDAFTRRTFALLGIGGTAAACMVPWTFFAGLYTVFRLPLWGLWIATAAALHAVSLYRLWRDTPWIQPVGVGFGLAAVAAALVVQQGYDDGVALHGEIVPLVRPYPGFGVLLAVLGAIFATVAAAATQRRAPATASNAGPHRRVR